MSKQVILSPKEWTKKVYGKPYLEYLKEEWFSHNTLFDMMQAYGDYVKSKTKLKSHK